MTGELRLVEVDPCTDARWDALMRDDLGSVFGSPPWLRALVSAYALHIAPRGEQSGALADFMDWLASPSTARLHLGLVGLPSDRHLTKIQVQVSRMTLGEEFPLHVDTAEPALACIYNFSEGLADDAGGALRFARDDGARDIVIPPQFNSACFFLSTHAAHEVTTVTKPDALRYSATAFYVWKPA